MSESQQTDPRDTRANEPEVPVEVTEAEAQTAVEEAPELEILPPEPEPAPDPAKEMQEQLLRLRADFENFRKRTRREKEEWNTRALENICGDLLAVLDSFELGLKNAVDVGVSEDVQKGFRLVRDQLRSILGKYGLSEINAEGQVFDPNLHEAIAQVPSPEVAAGGVMAMTRRGYKLGERLLRAAQVVVSQGAPEAAAPETEPAAAEAAEGGEN